MGRWADYVIVKVKYKHEDGVKYIESAQMFKDTDSGLMDKKMCLRKELLELLVSKNAVMTIYLNGDGNYRKGQLVELYDDKWIRTSAEGKEEDDLGALAQY